MKQHSGFTLIELLIVVGIIAVLALIAVPNFLSAQIRAKVAAVKSDQRVIAGALEAYITDNNHYPPGSGIGWYYTSPFCNPVARRFYALTTPIAYITTIPKETFKPQEAWSVADMTLFDSFDYVNADDVPTRGCGLTSGGSWRIASAGPDLYQAYGGRPVENADCNALGIDYDPTNGVISAGDIARCGPPHNRYGDPMSPSNANRPGIVRVPNYVEQW